MQPTLISMNAAHQLPSILPGPDHHLRSLKLPSDAPKHIVTLCVTAGKQLLCSQCKLCIAAAGSTATQQHPSRLMESGIGAAAGMTTGAAPRQTPLTAAPRRARMRPCRPSWRRWSCAECMRSTPAPRAPAWGGRPSVYLPLDGSLPARAWVFGLVCALIRRGEE